MNTASSMKHFAEYARRASLYVSLDGYDISGDFAPYLLDFTYTDNRALHSAFLFLASLSFCKITLPEAA